MTDEEILNLYRETKCPEGSRAEIDLDTNEVGCFTPAGERVAPLTQPEPAKAGMGVLGWSAVAGGLLIGAALVLGWRG
jgi:hypothetical protein